MKRELTHKERKDQILLMAARDSSVKVSQLSNALGVSITTIRNDIQSLIEQGIMFKVKGQIYPIYHPLIIEREFHNHDKKLRVAEAAASFIKNNDVIMISSGTTVAAIPRFLIGKQNIKIITHSTFVLRNLSVSNNIELTLLGGEFRGSSELTGGQSTVQQLTQYYAKYSFIGSDGFSVASGNTSHLEDASSIAKMMFDQSEYRVLCTDSSKYNQKGFIKVAPLEAFDIIITDNDLDKEAIAQIKELDIELILV